MYFVIGVCGPVSKRLLLSGYNVPYNKWIFGSPDYRYWKIVRQETYARDLLAYEGVVVEYSGGRY